MRKKFQNETNKCLKYIYADNIHYFSNIKAIFHCLLIHNAVQNL